MPRGKFKPVVPVIKWPFRKGDEVVVIAGADKGARGKVLRLDRKRNRVTVEGVNRVKRHQRPTQTNPQGGIVEREQPIHLSNVMLWDKTAQKPTRVGRKILEDGSIVRVARKSGEVLEG